MPNTRSRIDTIGQNGNEGEHYSTDLPTDYQRYIHKSRYARFRDDLGRRETWEETVDRYFEYWRDKLSRDTAYGKAIHMDLLEGLTECREEVLKLDTMPSMRCMMTAGEALDRDNVAGYNCSYLPVDTPRSFDEAMYILMCGTGVGFSVERQYISKLPEVAEEFEQSDTTIVVADSKIGWAKAYRELIQLLYAGQEPKWDLSKIRPAGARLKTFGGRASGPEPLEDLFKFTVEIFRGATGRKLTSIECHDLMCKVAEAIVVGGVRRSALISLSNLTDERMRNAKSGNWWDTEPHRALANNSVSYTEKPDMGIFMREWESLYASKSGERGIFSRQASKRTVEKIGRREVDYDFGTNPCSEIILRPRQFCNLSEVVVRPRDSLDDLKRKVRAATILGTLQSTLTDFRYLSKKWADNTKEERLLGVSLTGISEHPVLSGRSKEGFFTSGHGSSPKSLEEALRELKEVAIETNNEWAKRLGIEPSCAITCVKPSGTVSQLVDSSSGIHPRYSPYYIRTVRTDKKDPIYEMLKDQNVPVEDAIGKENSTAVFSFPVKSPEGAVTRDEVSAIDQLELWKVYAENWCEHKPSITVYVKEHEWMEVGAWVYEHFDILSGVSFLPHSDHVYRQAPYQEIDKETYEEVLKNMPVIDWNELVKYEDDDQTIGSQELACVAGHCEI